MASGKVVFFGTAQVGIPFLHQLQLHYSVELVVTQPDSRGGRNRQCLEAPVKCFARQKNLPLIQPEKLNDPSLLEKITAHTPDIGVVIAYGKWIPPSLYALPRFHIVNVHFSLLPRWRGAAPVQRAIEAGESRTGITIFEITREMDAGDIWAQLPVDILPDETSEELMIRMGEIGAPFLIETIEGIFSGTRPKMPQTQNQATFAKILEKEEGRIDWRQTAQEIYNRFRAFSPWPGVFFSSSGKILKVKKMHIAPYAHDRQAGEVLRLEKQAMYVCCSGQSVLAITSIQPPGKTDMSPYCFCLGNCFPPVLP